MQIGNINLMLLQALKDSSKYGLEIVKFISDATNGEIQIKQPSLYSGLTRLEKRGLITSHWEDSDIGGRRHYYTITELGLTQLKLHKDDLNELLEKTKPGESQQVDSEDLTTTKTATTISDIDDNEDTKDQPTFDNQDVIAAGSESSEYLSNDNIASSNFIEETTKANDEPVDTLDDLNAQSASLEKQDIERIELTDYLEKDINTQPIEDKETINEDLEILSDASNSTKVEPDHIIENNETTSKNNESIVLNNNQTSTFEFESTETKVDETKLEEITIDPITFDDFLKNPKAETKKLAQLPKEKINADSQKIEITAKNDEAKQSFSAYSPSPNADSPGKKSYSQKMRDYVEPQNEYNEFVIQNTKSEAQDASIKLQDKDKSYINKIDDSIPLNNDVNSTQSVIKENVNSNPEAEKVAHYSTPLMTETQVEYIHKKESDDDIDYKNILGDLDADLNKTPKVEEQPRSPMQPVQKISNSTKESKRSIYTKKLEEILLSASDNQSNITTSNRKIERIDNEKRFEELNRRYEGKAEIRDRKQKNEKTENDNNEASQHTIETKSTGYTHILQDKITIKPYIKEHATKASDKIYLLISKFNLLRAIIITILIGLELGISYAIFNANGLIDHSNNTALILYIVAAVIGGLYCLSIIISATQNWQKKIVHEEISWGIDLFYRFLLAVILITFVIALNLFMGMINFFDPTYLVQWFVPCIMIINIIFSSFVGYLMYRTKIFRV